MRLWVKTSEFSEGKFLACGDSSIRVSRFNAARIFGCMALLLGIPLSARIGKEIRF